MKVTKKQFLLFKRECEYWIKRLELNGYKFYYHLRGANEDSFCTIQVRQVGHVISIFLAEDFYSKDDLSVTDKLKETAKHEMIHALLSRMSSNMDARFLSEDDAVEFEEETVRKLEKIIN